LVWFIVGFAFCVFWMTGGLLSGAVGVTAAVVAGSTRGDRAAYRQQEPG
jgi:hypothetical protein